MNYIFMKSYYNNNAEAGLLNLAANDFPLQAVYNSTLLIKNDNNATANADNATFYSAVATRGAICQIATSNTWTELIDISGGGFLAWILGSSHTDVHTSSMRIVVDGATTSISHACESDGRLLLGLGYNLIPSVATGTYVDKLLGYSDKGYQGLDADNNRKLINCYLKPANHLLAAGYTLVRFATSLNICVKSSVIPADYDAYAACSYCLDNV